MTRRGDSKLGEAARKTFMTTAPRFRDREYSSITPGPGN